METPLIQKDHSELSHTSAQTNHGELTGPDQADAQTHVNDPSPETPEVSTTAFGSESGGFMMIPLDQIFIDASIFPRVAPDPYTIEKYAGALIRGEQLPPIAVEVTEEGEYRILKGVHRFEAYGLRQSIYTGKCVADFYDEPLPLIADENLSTIPCFVETIPPNTHPMVFCMKDNLIHGKPPTPDDYKKVSRQLYRDNEGGPVEGLAKLIRISRNTFTKYVADLVDAFEEKKGAIILELHHQGVAQTEIANELQNRFPKAKGIKQSQISKFLLKIANQDKPGEEQDDSGTGEPNLRALGPVNTTQDGQDDVEKTHDGKEPEAPISGPQPEPPGPTHLEVAPGTNGDSIMILGVRSLPDHLQEQLKKAVDELVEQIRTEAAQHEEQKTDSKETPPAGPAERDPDNGEAINQKSEPAVPDNQVRKFIPAIHSSRGSRPMRYSM